MLIKLHNIKLNDKEQGFTLIELLVVIVIIGILAAIALPIFLNQQKAAINASVKSDARNTVTEVHDALVKNPQATAFIPYAGPANVPTVASGEAAVHVVATSDNEVVIVDPDDGGDDALAAYDGGSRGSWAGYVIHAESPSTGYWYEFNSLTGKYSDGETDPSAGGGTPGGGTPGGGTPGSGSGPTYVMTAEDLKINGSQLYNGFTGYTDGMDDQTNFSLELNSPDRIGVPSTRNFTVDDFSQPLVQDILDEGSGGNVKVDSMILHGSNGVDYNLCNFTSQYGDTCWVSIWGSDQDIVAVYFGGYHESDSLIYGDYKEFYSNFSNCTYDVYYNAATIKDSVSGGSLEVTYNGSTSVFNITANEAWMYSQAQYDLCPGAVYNG